MDPRGSVAESEHYDEAAMRRIDRPPDLPFPEVAHESMLGDPSTSIGLQFAPQPTPFVPFEFNQQLEGPAGHIRAQNVDLLEDIQLELAEAELRHEAARYQILEKAQRFPAASHPGAMAIGYGDSMMDERASGFPEAIITTLVPVDLHQTGNSMYGSGLGICSGQQMLQNTDYRSNYRDRIHDPCQLENAFLNIQESDYHALDLATCSQQPAVDPMALGAPYCNIKATDFNTPPGGSSWNEFINPSAHHSLTTAVFEPPSFPTINHSVATDVDMTGTDSSSLSRRTIGEQAGLPKRKHSSSHRTGDSGTQSGHALENIHFYRNPDAEPHCREPEPKRRRVTDKAPSSCFGCRLSKRKCTVLTGDVCLQCQNILKRYTDLTAIPKFTCTVRTSFLEMGFSMCPSMAQISVYEICDKPRSVSSLTPKTAENDGIPASKTSSYNAVLYALEAVREALRRVRNLLDLLEPLHIRRKYPLDFQSATLWSYSSSMFKWKSLIRFFWPDLQDVLESHAHFHRFLTLACLSQLDDFLVSKRVLSKSLFLSICYEEICAMEDDPTVNIQARQHTLASLRHCILHVYRNTFPKTATRDKHKRESDMYREMFYYNISPHTRELLPEGYRPPPRGFYARDLVRRQEEQLTDTSYHLSSQGYSMELRIPSPVEAYFPAEIAAIFNLTRNQRDVFEKIAQKSLMTLPTWIRKDALEFSPWSLSIALKAFLKDFDFESCRRRESFFLLQAITVASFLVWDLVMYFCERGGTLLQLWDIGARITTDSFALEAFLIKRIASGKGASLLVERGILKRRPEKASP